MSILLAAGGGSLAAWVLGAWLIASLAALAIINSIGTFQRKADTELMAAFDGEPVLPMLLNLLAAAAVYFGASMMCLVVIAVVGGEVDLSDPKTYMYGGRLVSMVVTMSTAALVSLLVGIGLFIRDGFARIGFDRSPWQGVKYGAVTVLAASPLLLLTLAAEGQSRDVTYDPDKVHDLLKTMQPNDTLVRLGALFSVMVLAPLSEELFFRAHLQPMLQRMFSGKNASSQALQVMHYPPPIPSYPPPPMYENPAYPAPLPPTFIPPEPGAGPAAVLPVFTQQPAYRPPVYLSPVYAPRPAAPSKWPIVLAILMTSALFAMIHPAFSWGTIFILSLGLGFAYYRTGNLWVPILMHAAFNGLMSTFFLSRIVG